MERREELTRYLHTAEEKKRSCDAALSEVRRKIARKEQHDLLKAYQALQLEKTEAVEALRNPSGAVIAVEFMRKRLSRAIEALQDFEEQYGTPAEDGSGFPEEKTPMETLKKEEKRLSDEARILADLIRDAKEELECGA